MEASNTIEHKSRSKLLEIHANRQLLVNHEFLWVLWAQFAIGLIWAAVAGRNMVSSALPVSPLTLVLTGGLVASLLPTIAILWKGKHIATPYVSSLGQIGWSAIIVMVTGGQWQSNLHLFGSLVLISRYATLGPLLLAVPVGLAAVGTEGPFLASGSSSEILEFSCWTVFAVSFLVSNTIRLRKGMVWLAAALAHEEDRAAYAEEQVAERTTDLRRALSQIEQSAQGQSQFLASMSHELRTPMNGILGMAGSLAESGLTPGQAEDLGTLVQSAEALNQILTGVMDLALIKVGKIHLISEPFRLVETVEDVCASFALRAHASGLDFGVSLPETTPTVVSDVVKFRMILSSLIDNALKFTPEGSVAVSVEVAAPNRNTLAVVVQVIDTGIGMSVETQNAVFGPFSQADGSASCAGLGLTICQEYCRLLDGQLGVQSEPGWGTSISLRFTFPMVDMREYAAIPSTEINQMDVAVDHALADSVGRQLDAIGVQYRLVDSIASVSDADVLFASTEFLRDDTQLHDDVRVFRVEAKEAHASVPGVTTSWIVAVLVSEVANRFGHQVRSAESLVGDGPLPWLGWSILLVEDNKVNQKVALRTLEKLGCQVTIAEDGSQAVAHCAGQAFDMVLMDVQMPVMDGIEATRIIRETRPGVPIVALTAATSDEDRIRCRDAGMNAFLFKPFRTTDLLRITSDLAERRSAA